MLCEIRFVAKGEKYDKTFAKKVRECLDLEEALRWAAATIKQSEPSDVAQITSVRIRPIVTDQSPAAPLDPPPPPIPQIVEDEPRARKRGAR